MVFIGNETESRLLSVIRDIQSKIGATVDGLVGNNTIQKCKEYQQAHRISSRPVYVEYKHAIC